MNIKENLIQHFRTSTQVEIFKTNVNDIEVAETILKMLQNQFPGYLFNFDLDDCDRILRVESVSAQIDIDHILYAMTELGFKALHIK